LIGRIIGVQFNYRDDYTRRVDADWFSGHLNRYDRTAKIHSRFEKGAAVLIPATALSWFQSLPTDYRDRREAVVYAQVEEDSSGTVLRLLGTQIRRDMSGAGEITW
jgi:hypothetical protein